MKSFYALILLPVLFLISTSAYAVSAYVSPPVSASPSGSGAYYGPPPQPPVSANTLPPGSYLQTCSNCNISSSTTGTNLTCLCMDRRQIYTATTLSNASQCGYVTNNNGQLYCQQVITGPLPPGSYMQTCQSCQFNGNQLSCQCQTKNQYWIPTSLYNANNCSWIVNNNGNLQCANSYNGAGLPPGTYLQTCQSCQFDGNQLSCQCLTRNQYWRPTTLYDAGRCNSIVNRDGFLQCSYQFRPHARAGIRARVYP